MKQKNILRQAKGSYGEDRIIIKDNLFMVIDGATPLYDFENRNPKMLGYRYKTWASWLVSELKKEINKNDNLEETLENVSIRLYNEFIKINPDDKKYYPSCNFSLVQIINDKASFMTIGDCEALIKFKNGNYKRLYQPELYKLDQMALNEMIRINGQRKDIIDILRKNRAKMNEKDGYNTYTISNNPNFIYLKEEYNLDDIDTIYLYSDGISQAFEQFKIENSPEALFNKYDIDEIVNKIVLKAKEDPNIKKYPRFKYIDDIAVIKITN